MSWTPRRRVNLPRLRACALVSLTFAWLLLAAPVSVASPKPHAELAPTIEDIGSKPVEVHHPPRPRLGKRARAAEAKAVASAYGGNYRSSTGEYVRVLMSDAFVPDDAVAQSWADFIASLKHDFEIAHVTVYVAPLWEVQALCDEFSNACYRYNDDLLIVPGDETADGTSLADVAAHEYGHHLASWRSNPPWSAFDYGPTNWATYERVCPRLQAGSAVLGDPAFYHLDPGEAFAEAYRVLNGGQWGGIVDQSFTRPLPR